MDNQVINKCHCCGRRNETLLHISRCPNKGRRLMFNQSTEALASWMERSNSHPEIILAICSYLRYRGRVTMKKICQDSHILTQFAKETDLLGWRNFTEARITNTLFLIQEEWLDTIGSKLSINSWTKQFLIKILNIIHHQWLYRNSRIHISHVEGLTFVTHERIMNHTKSLILTDPMDLLPQHRSLLQIDYEALGKGSTVNRQYWIAQIESALASRKRKMSYIIDETHDSKKRR